MQFYSDPEREADAFALPDCEVFYAAKGELAPPEGADDDTEPSAAGWYYWYCLPGCMPDSDPIGPYATEGEAIQAAQDEAAQ